jgi:hypothetical protein
MIGKRLALPSVGQAREGEGKIKKIANKINEIQKLLNSFYKEIHRAFVFLYLLLTTINFPLLFVILNF